MLGPLAVVCNDGLHIYTHDRLGIINEDVPGLGDWAWQDRSIYEVVPTETQRVKKYELSNHLELVQESFLRRTLTNFVLYEARRMSFPDSYRDSYMNDEQHCAG